MVSKFVLAVCILTIIDLSVVQPLSEKFKCDDWEEQLTTKDGKPAFRYCNDPWKTETVETALGSGVYILRCCPGKGITKVVSEMHRTRVIFFYFLFTGLVKSLGYAWNRVPNFRGFFP